MDSFQGCAVPLMRVRERASGSTYLVVLPRLFAAVIPRSALFALHSYPLSLPTYSDTRFTRCFLSFFPFLFFCSQFVSPFHFDIPYTHTPK